MHTLGRHWRPAAALFASAAALLIGAPVASAHTGTVTVSCTGVEFDYSQFPSSGGTATETVSVDGSPVAAKTFTFTSATATDTIPLSLTGTRSISGSTTFHSADGFNGSGSDTETLNCGTPPTQTIAGHIYDCSSGSQTTTEVPGGTLGATGQQAVGPVANPLGPTPVAAGDYTMTATAPPGYMLVQCGGTANPPDTEKVTVPPGGAGVGIFYVAKRGGSTCTGAPAAYPALDGAGALTVFALNGGGTQSVNFSLTTITGDVGVAAGAKVTNQAPSTVKGNVFVASGGSFTGPGKVTGSVLTGQDLSAARTAAINAGNAAAALPPDQTFANITSNTTITGHSGLNVIDVTGNINLSNGSLTLSGPADAFFIVNVGGSLTLGGSGGIKVGGSVPASHLLINMFGAGKSVNTHVGNVVQGTLLGPQVGGSLDGAFGSLLLGRNFSLMSGVTITFQGCPPAE